MTMRTVAIAIGLGVFLFAGIADAAVDPEASCKEAKAKATGKKAFDLMKAFGKNIKKPDPAKLGANVSKAQSKFTKGFSTAESKGGCATSGDSDAVEETVDGFVLDTLCSVVGGCVTAKQITDTADCVGGPLSDCRVGDYLLENDQIRVVIQGIQRNIFSIAAFGGQIIDADLRRVPGEEEIDNFKEWATSINVENTAHYTDITIINDGSDGNPAVIRATGPDDLMDWLNPSTVVSSFGFAFPAAADDRDLPVETSTDYILEPDKNYVRVETTVQNTNPSGSVGMYFGDFLNGSGQLEVFQPGYGVGEPLITSACPPLAAKNPCNVLAYRGVDNATGVSYGYVHDVLSSTSFTDSALTVTVLGREIMLVLLGIHTPNYTLEPQGQVGDQVTVTRYFVVGDGTVASILNARNEIQGIETGTVTGTVEVASEGPVAGAEVALLGDPAEGPLSPLTFAPADLNVVSHTVTNEAGEFSLSAAPGTYDVVVNLEGYPYQGGGSTPALNPAVITGGAATDLGTITLPETGFLQVTVADGGGSPLPARASVVGFDPSPPYRNAQTVAGVIDNETSVFRDRDSDGLPFGFAQALFIEPSGTSDLIPLEPGEYAVVVSRGPEYSIDSDSKALAAGETWNVTAKIAPVTDSTGFIGSDFHLHNILSHDSEVTPYERVVSMMAEGLEFFTPSDHEYRSDFNPLIASKGWQSLVNTAVNAEITTFDYGHFNAWPMTVDPGQVNGGAVDHGGAAPAGQDFPSYGNYNLTPEEIIALAHADPGTDTVQINHIHSFFSFEQGGTDLGSGLAIDTGLEPPKSAIHWSTRRLDPAKEDPQTGYFTDTFDALEIWIGAGRSQNFNNFLGQNAGDWFNLLNQGILRTGVADSDTHARITNQSGIPRTMVASTVTDLTLIDPEVHSATVNAGKAFGTNAPIVRVTLEALTSGQTASLELGDPTLVSAGDGKVEVTVDIQSPLWAEFDTVEYYLNSTTIKTVLEDLETGNGECSVAGTLCKVNLDCPPTETCLSKVDVPRYGIAPDFVDTPTVSTVLVDGSVPGGSRLEATSILTLDEITEPALTEDTWIVVMVKGTDGVSKPLFPVLPNSIDSSQNSTLADLMDGNLDEQGILALAFTNPLFVDVDDGAGGLPDGDFDPPGVSFIVGFPSGAFLDQVGGLVD